MPGGGVIARMPIAGQASKRYTPCASQVACTAATVHHRAMVDKRSEGVVGVPFAMAIERGKIAEFARSVAAAHADHQLDERAVIPPTFLTSMFHWERAADDANPWPRVKMSKQRGMHASQQYEFFGPPPRAGDLLTATSRIERIWDKAGRRGGMLTFVDMVTEYRNADGELVAQARMTAVETGIVAGTKNGTSSDA